MFDQRAKLTALAIVHIFETGSPLGDSSTVAVLNDKAGISYGKSQDTHRSGNLANVVGFYLENGSEVLHYDYLKKILPKLKDTSPKTVLTCQNDATLKQILRECGKTSEMIAAQEQNIDLRISKAVKACEGSNFNSTMSLAVIYDSINHGSWEKIRDRVTVRKSAFPDNESFEQAWIRTYVFERDEWLESIPRLAPTDYRTDFFKEQINKNNWDLKTPMDVHGFKLTEKHISQALQSSISVAKSEPVKKPDPVDPISEKEPEQPTQKIENQFNLNTDGTNQPPETEIKPEDKTVTAPFGQRLTEKIHSWFNWLGLAPPTAAGGFMALKSYWQDGQLNLAEILGIMLQVFYFVFPYLAGIVMLYIIYQTILMIFKQISFLMALWITGDPKKNNLQIVPANEIAIPSLWQRIQNVFHPQPLPSIEVKNV